MTDDMQRHRELENERDRRMEERFKAQDRAFQLQVADLKRRMKMIERAQFRMAGLMLGVAVTTAIIVYLFTATAAH